MYCQNCGSELKPGALFCENCGAKVAAGGEGQAGPEPESAFGAGAGERPEQENPFEEALKDRAGRQETADRPGSPVGPYISDDGEIKGSRVTENIYLCPDGKYRWVYELNMLKNPTIMITVLKVFAVTFVIVWLIDAVMSLFSGSLDSLPFSTLVIGGVTLFLMALGFVAYLIVAASYGWNYAVYFEMDEKSIAHIQMPKEVKKAEVLGWITEIAGLASGNFTVAGAGILAQTKDRSVTSFADAKQVVKVRNRNLIKVNQPLNYNQIYAEDADYDFVWEYISSRCVNAGIKE